jgi:hypothetical protein
VTLAGDRSTGGLIVRVEIGVRRKNTFRVWSGPSDGDGHVILSRNDMLNQAQRDREFSPMDYGDPEADFSSAITASIATSENIESAVVAYETFRVSYPFPLGYLDTLKVARERLRELGSISLRPSVVRQDPSESGSITCVAS